MVPKSQNLVRFTRKFPHQSIYRCWVRVWHWYFNSLYLKSIFRQIGHKFKTLWDLLKNLHLINLEHVECGYLTIFYSKPKFGQRGPKTKILSDLFEILFTIQYLKVLIMNLTSLFWYFNKRKINITILINVNLGKLVPKLKLH